MTDEWVLEWANMTRSLLGEMKKRQVEFIAHVLPIPKNFLKLFMNYFC